MNKPTASEIIDKMIEAVMQHQLPTTPQGLRDAVMFGKGYIPITDGQPFTDGRPRRLP